MQLLVTQLNLFHIRALNGHFFTHSNTNICIRMSNVLSHVIHYDMFRLSWLSSSG